MKRFALDQNNQVLAASVVWIVLTAAATSIFVLGTLGLYNGLQEPCVAFLGQAREQCLERRESLAALGVSVLGYTIFLVGSVIVKVLPWILVGVLIFWRRSNELFGILFSLAMILLGTMALDASVADWTRFYHPGLVLPMMVVEFVGIALIALLYAFPDGVFVPRWTRWLALVWVVGAFLSVFLRDMLALVVPPILLSSITAILVASLLYSLGVRYFQASNVLQKRQIRWLALGALIYGVVYSLRVIPALQSSIVVSPLPLGYVALLSISSGLFAVCLGISILRPRLLARSDMPLQMASENVNMVAAVATQEVKVKVETVETVPVETAGTVQVPPAANKARKKKKKGKKKT